MKHATILFALVWLTCAESSADVKRSAVASAPGVSRARSSTLQSRLHGIARPKLSATLRFLVPGTIATVHVVEGQAVHEGQPLVSLDDRLARARLRLAEISASRSGELEYAAVQLKFGEKQLSRLEYLLKRSAVSEREVEEQRALVERGRAVHKTQLEELQLAASSEVLAQEQLRHMTVFAPFDGIITELHEKLGVSVDPNTPVVSLANLARLQVEMHTPVTLYGVMRAGDSVMLAAGQPVNSQVPANVVSTSPIIILRAVLFAVS
jgi:RND family efflux transporter MFP subunit